MANDSFINSDLFRKEAVSAHKNRISGVVLLSPTVSHTWISIVVLTFSLILITFLCFASYSEQVKVSGWIEPKEGLTSVYSERHGHITSILVVVGQEVSAGDSLMSIGVVDSQSNKRKDYLIQSPVDGIITHINFDAGQLYSNNAPLVAIWPRSSTLVAKLLIPVAASGQIAEGQSVKLQYDAFPVRRFGLQGATIVWVAP